MRKLEKLLREDAERFYEFDAPFEKADIGVITWGLTASVTKEAIERLRSRGVKINALYMKLLWPVRKDLVEDFAKRCERVAMPETNWSGQLADILKQETHIRPVTFNIYRGEPMIPSEVEGFIDYLLENPEITEGRLTAADVFGKERVYGLI